MAEIQRNIDAGIAAQVEAQIDIAKPMQTEKWQVIDYLDLPHSKVSFYETGPLIEPEDAQEIRLNHYLESLIAKKNELETKTGYKHEIKKDPRTDDRLALFRLEDGKRQMFDGAQITMGHAPNIYDRSGIQFPVYGLHGEFLYSHWLATTNNKYMQIFADNGLPYPYAGFGVSVNIITKDGYNITVRRDLTTPVYPGMLYQPGGGINLNDKTPAEAIIRETTEELGLQARRDLSDKDLRVLALVVDKHMMDGTYARRPEIIGVWETKRTLPEVEQIQFEAAAMRGKKLQDVWYIEGVSTFAPTMAHKLLYAGREMCPPTEAALVAVYNYLNTQKYGPTQAAQMTSDLMRWINNFERVPFEIPTNVLGVDYILEELFQLTRQ